DRRHIQDRDVRILRQTVTQRLNLEMAAVDAIVGFACEIKPDEATLVPERREELTTEGGLDVVAHQEAVGRALERFTAPVIQRSRSGANRQGQSIGRQSCGNSDGPLLRSADARGPRTRVDSAQ